MRSIARLVVVVGLLAACKRSSGTSDSHEGAPNGSAAPSGSAHARIVDGQKKLDVLKKQLGVVVMDLASIGDDDWKPTRCPADENAPHAVDASRAAVPVTADWLWYVSEAKGPSARPNDPRLFINPQIVVGLTPKLYETIDESRALDAIEAWQKHPYVLALATSRVEPAVPMLDLKDKGQKFATGHIDGWWVLYERASGERLCMSSFETINSDELTVWTTKNEFGLSDDFQDKAWDDLVDAFHADVGDALKKSAGLTVAW